MVGLLHSATHKSTAPLHTKTVLMEQEVSIEPSATRRQSDFAADGAVAGRTRAMPLKVVSLSEKSRKIVKRTGST